MGAWVLANVQGYFLVFNIVELLLQLSANYSNDFSYFIVQPESYRPGLFSFFMVCNITGRKGMSIICIFSL